MNVEATAYVRPPIRGEVATALETDGPYRLLSGPGGQSLDVQQLYRSGTPLTDVYRQSIDPMVDLLVAGFNVSVIVTGESNSGKTYAVAGENASGTGLVPMVLDALFQKVKQDERLSYESNQRSEAQVSLEVYEVYNELVKDLLQIPGVAPKYLNLDETSPEGVHVKNGRVAQVRDSAEGQTLFRQAWARRSDHYTDFGPAKKYSAVVIHIGLTMASGESPLPNRARFTFVVTPGAEKLSEDPRQLRLREGGALNKSIVAMSQLVAALANQQYADRVVNYSESNLTSLLRDELGGNCKTCVLLCLRPHTDPQVMDPILRFTNQCTQVKNFPILNDPFAQQLVTQYRAQVLNLKQQLGWSTGLPNASKIYDTHDEMRRLHNENVTLRDQNDRLQERLDHLHNRFGTLASAKTDLSTQLLMTEEEKLKVSKTMVEMQIENNKLKEDCEAAKFELTNKILQLENDLMQLDMDRDKHSRAEAEAQQRLTALERDHKSMADQFINQKANYSGLRASYDREVKKNEELSVELLNLVNTKAALIKRLEKLESSSKRGVNTENELERIRAIVSRMSMRQDDFEAHEEERQRIGRDILGSKAQFEKEIKTLRVQYDEHIRKLEQKIGSMKKEILDSRNIARERQRKVSEISARLITLKGEADHLQNQNNKLQHKMKDTTVDLKTRLVKYVEDIAEYMDSRGDTVRKPGEDQMRDYVAGMLTDLRKAHKLREEQLSQAAHGYRERLKSVISTHEKLLIAYRELRLRMESMQRGGDPELIPDEYELALNDPEFASGQQKEMDRLKEQLDTAMRHIESLKLGIKVDDLPDIQKIRPSGLEREKSWAELRRQLRQWTVSTQHQLEAERAQLLTTTTVLEEENKELKNYIDTHLKRYKEEITRLREMLGVTDTGGLETPGPYISKRR